MSTTDLPLVSVVVLNRDEREIDETLDRLAAQCQELDDHLGLPGAAEIVVVDASQGRLDDIRLAHPDARWFDFTAPFGVGVTIPHQRNFGVRAALGSIVAFCDATGQPEPGWLVNLTAPLLDGSLSVTCGPVRSLRDGVYGMMNDLEDGTPVEAVLTANLAFTIDAFEAIGGFDERYAYGSDADFAWRLSDAGTPAISVQAAVMGMDWGESSQQRKRSWRYGRARMRLLRLHGWPRRVRQVRTSPELAAYPLWLLGSVPALALSWRRRALWPLAAWVGALAIPAWKNRREPDLQSVLTDHVVQGAAALTEAASIAAPFRGAVAFTPKIPEPYFDELLPALADQGVKAYFLTGPTRSATVNLALAPLSLVRAKLAGTKVVHLHWVFGFTPAWAKRHRLTRRLCRAWFGLWLRVVADCGLKLVWTAHNLMPHEPVFDDDLAARCQLAEAADVIIAHNAATAAELVGHFGVDPDRVSVIAQGNPAGAVVVPRSDARSALAVPVGVPLIAAIGTMRRYKGHDTLLTAAGQLGSVHPDLHVALAGACPDKPFQRELTDEISELRRSGIEARIDARHLPVDELNALICAADVVVFPFREITNSSSLRHALACGALAVVPDLPALADIPGVVRFDPAAGPAALADAIEAGLSLTAAQRQGLVAEARSWVSERTWAHTAAETRQAYERATAK